MEKILKLLVEGLDPDEKDEVVRRVEAMESELKYMVESKPDQIRKADQLGWSVRKLYAIFCLNSFYQRILAPMWASTISPAVIGSEIPIRYGKSIVFDDNRNQKIDKMGTKFVALCKSAGIERFMLEAQRTSDLIWRITNPLEDFDAYNSTE